MDPQSRSATGAVIDLDEAQRRALVDTKATCPFIGAAVASEQLPVRNAVDNPLAAVDDVRELGNRGGGDLGDLLAFFASGNHAMMRGDAGVLDTPVPPGLFSLEFPGSQGSHPGHSGILEQAFDVPGSGRLSVADFERLAGRARDGRVARSQVADFIAENLARDPSAKVFAASVARLLARDLASFVGEVGPALLDEMRGSGERAARSLEPKLTRLLGEDNLVGSAGEFGLLFAFFANKPKSPTQNGEPALDVADVRDMFVAKRLPHGWETWRKSRADWVVHTTALLIDAGKAYLARKRR